MAYDLNYRSIQAFEIDGNTKCHEIFAGELLRDYRLLISHVDGNTVDLIMLDGTTKTFTLDKECSRALASPDVVSVTTSGEASLS